MSRRSWSVLRCERVRIHLKHDLPIPHTDVIRLGEDTRIKSHDNQIANSH